MSASWQIFDNSLLSQYRLNTNNMLVISCIPHIISGFNLLPFVIVFAFFAHQSCLECCTSVTSWRPRWSTSSTRCSITSPSRSGPVNGAAALSGCKNEKVVITPGHDLLLLLTRQCVTPVLHRQRRLWTLLRFTRFLEGLPVEGRKKQWSDSWAYFKVRALSGAVKWVKKTPLSVHRSD